VRFFSITKPGIIFGNLITATGGFFLGSRGDIPVSLLGATLLGMALVVASGCVINNVVDRDIDSLMQRTCDRVLVKGEVSPGIALVYAFFLGLVGFLVLWFGTNPLCVAAAAVGWLVYVGVYTLALKRKSTWGTTLGGISGSVPPVVGYVAITNRLDLGALLLFLILFFWQMPHFYAISIYRLEDFKKAGIPILPVKKGLTYTKWAILAYIVAFTIIAVLPAFFGYAGWPYGVVALAIGLTWLYLAVANWKSDEIRIWARKLFLFSIMNITILCLMMAIK